MNIKAYGKTTNRFHLAIYSHNKLVGTQYDDPCTTCASSKTNTTPLVPLSSSHYGFFTYRVNYLGSRVVSSCRALWGKIGYGVGTGKCDKLPINPNPLIGKMG